MVGQAGSADTGAVTARDVSTAAGSVILMRGAETFSLREGDVLREGDIVIARSSGAATIVYGETCTRTLGALQSLTIDEKICEQVVAAVDDAGLVVPEGVNGTEALIEADAAGAFPWVGALLTTGGAVGAAGAAGGGGGGEAGPAAASPPPPVVVPTASSN